jgi:flagellar M-ring protein FliF
MERVRVTLNDWSSIVRYAALILMFLLVYVLLLRPVKKQILKIFRELPARTASEKAQTGGAGGRPGLEQEVVTLPIEQQRSLTLKKQLIDKVKSEPTAASQLVQAWLHEESK